MDANEDSIYNFLSNDIVARSDPDRRICFVAFCFEYKAFMDHMKDKNSGAFTTHLPIRLDASCNGYQHISMLTRDVITYKHLNLAASSHDDTPGDFYTYILKEVIYHINVLKDTGKFKDAAERFCIDKLSNRAISRKMIKKLVMAYSYNISTIEMANSFKEGLIPIDTVQINEKKEKENVVVYKVEDRDTHALTNDDIFRMISYFKEAIHASFPRMKLLKDYISGIVSICTKINKPIPWTLPSGAPVCTSSPLLLFQSPC